MHFLTILLLTLASAVLNVSGASLPGTSVYASRRLHYMVPRTLQEGLVSRNELNRRQCPGGENCIDGGCCPIGYVCYASFTPDSGCCPDGNTCSGPPSGCSIPGWASCPGIDACCATASQCPSNINQGCGDTSPPNIYTPPTATYTPPTATYTPPTATYTPPTITFTPLTTTHTSSTTSHTSPATGGASVAGAQPTVTVNGARSVRALIGGPMAVMMGALAVLA